jgi:hypothetical protein
LNSIWVCEGLPLAWSPNRPNFVVPGADGCLVLASYGLHLTGEGPQGIFYFAKFWEVKVPWQHTNNCICLSQREYFAFQLFSRALEFSTILHGGNFFQQFIIDAWAAIKQNKLRYIRMNQAVLRANLYQGLADAVKNDVEGNLNLQNLERHVILPSSHIGKTCNMFAFFQDSMAITKFYQHLDIFGTMTANPNWPKYKKIFYLNNGGRSIYILAHVFEQKCDALFYDIKKRHWFGELVAYVYVIEFEKHSLPHMHFLIFLTTQDKIREAA